MYAISDVARTHLLTHNDNWLSLPVDPDQYDYLVRCKTLEEAQDYCRDAVRRPDTQRIHCRPYDLDVSHPQPLSESEERSVNGLSVREFFAGCALIGILAYSGPDADDDFKPGEFATMSFDMAEAMLTESQRRAK